MKRSLDVIQAYFRRRIQECERQYDAEAERQPISRVFFFKIFR